MLPLFKPQVGCVGVAVAVIAVEAFTVTVKVDEHPPASVTVRA
jgi:hypothetical protein